MDDWKLPDSEPEFPVFGTRCNLDKHTSPSLKVGDSYIINNKTIQFLEVMLDPLLTFKNHTTNRSKTALYNLSLIHKKRNFLTADQLKMLMWSLLLSHLDYSNATLVNSPDEISKQFQHVQNVAANIYLTREIG